MVSVCFSFNTVNSTSKDGYACHDIWSSENRILSMHDIMCFAMDLLSTPLKYFFPTRSETGFSDFVYEYPFCLTDTARPPKHI